MRQPIVAGQFYASSERGCLDHLKRIDAEPARDEDIPKRLVAAIVPHAGWDCSGHIAMKAFRTAEGRIDPEATLVLFGAVHSYGIARASVCTLGKWITPLGAMDVDNDLSEHLLAEGNGLLIADSAAHTTEHSIEVQMPMLRHVFGDRTVVAIAVPPRADSHIVGRRVAEIAQAADRPVFIVGTTDLTHYGSMGYDFAPRGDGPAALAWVKTENDARMVALMREVKADEIVAEARCHHNACGAGAVAATLGAARQLGATEGHLLAYTTSYDVLKDQLYGDRIGDFVGYAGLVF